MSHPKHLPDQIANCIKDVFGTHFGIIGGLRVSLLIESKGEGMFGVFSKHVTMASRWNVSLTFKFVPQQEVGQLAELFTILP